MAATDFKDYYAILRSVRLPVLMLNRLFANWHANTTDVIQATSRQSPLQEVSEATKFVRPRKTPKYDQVMETG